jgi:hypothetical protein
LFSAAALKKFGVPSPIAIAIAIASTLSQVRRLLLIHLLSDSPSPVAS